MDELERITAERDELKLALSRANKDIADWKNIASALEHSALSAMLDNVLQELKAARECALAEADRANRAEVELNELRAALRTFMETLDVQALKPPG